MAADRLRGALLGAFAGDALASPTHWYYGGQRQVEFDYGGPLTGYAQPRQMLEGSILPRSNTDGAGRGSNHPGKKTIIGDVINHGKKPFWEPTRSYHYHCTLEAGENTLEASLARLLVRTAAAQGRVDADAFRDAYVTFMQTPGSHNDTYASTAHRMFFANLVHGKRDPKDCPDNDGHNVDTVDGLVLPAVAAAVAAYQGGPAEAGLVQARDAAVAIGKVTRNSRAVDAAAAALAAAVHGAIHGLGTAAERVDAAAAALGMRPPHPFAEDAMVS